MRFEKEIDAGGGGISRGMKGTMMIDSLVLAVLRWMQKFTHIVISTTLVGATVLLTLYLLHEIYDAIEVHTFIKGFMHALGILLLLWTMTELLATELHFMRSGKIEVEIFVEVALIVVIREIIMLPVGETHPQWYEVATWVSAATLLGLTYMLVQVGKRREPRKTRFRSREAVKV